jgi:hemerythrin
MVHLCKNISFRGGKTMLKWNDNYKTGIAIVDEQHYELFKIANNGYELLKNSFYTDKYDRIIQILDELKTYTIFHFKTEEDYMLSIGYKKFLSHKVEHDDFIKKVNNVDLTKIDQNQDEYIMGILTFIVKWIEDHILEKDKLIS